MKKNKMMRTASVLLVAALMTTSMISGTFAKYTTSATGTDTARVAKFGVNITASGGTFAKSYKEGDANNLKVNSSEKVVAPGTNGSMAAISITGTPEVAVKVSYKSDFEIGDNWKVGEDNTFYCPLKVTIKSSTETNGLKIIDGATYTDADAFEQAVEGAIDGYSQTYAPGVNLNDKSSENLTISWEWPFTANQNDVKDTELGNDVANDSSNNAHGTVSLNLTTTVEQIGTGVPTNSITA